MKLLRVGRHGEERLAVVRDDGDVWDVSGVAGDLGDVLARPRGMQELRDAVERRGDTLPPVDLGSTRVGPPIPRPHQILCIGLNYADHAAETGAEPPSEPVVFTKAPNTLVGPNDDLLLPRGSSKVDWEVELGIVVGARSRYLRDPAAAAAHIAGYVVVNDVSERVFQLERGGQWVKGKSCETFNPCGPYLVTPDEVADPQRLALRLWVNGELMQDGTTESMVFSAHHLVWYLSQFMVLEPGDLINTGTPPGVGMGRDPQVWLAPGDVVELEIDGLGRQRQVCVAEGG